MTDSQAVPQPASTGTQSPLDVLDQILNDAKTKAAQAADDKAAEEAKKQEEEHLRRKIEEEKRVAAQRTELQAITQSPQYQARVQQQQEEQETLQKEAQQMDGMQIHQLGHKKM